MRLLDRAIRTVTNARTPIDFATTGDANWPVWDRYLTLHGRRAYYLGNVCGTCAYLFKRMKHAAKTVDVPRLSAQLAAGVTRLAPDLIDEIATILPSSNYHVILLEICPRQVFPGSADDYFACEQVANENDCTLDRRWGLPASPRVAYYRPEGRADLPIGEADGRLFEFVVPMVPSSTLDRARVAYYASALDAGAAPTAFALSLLDIKGPAEGGRPHWCLAHFLLDGHHKLAAAAERRRPLTLIAFICDAKGVSEVADIEAVLATYAGAGASAAIR